jgi:DNA-binding FadR family transcriptional regulator
VSDDPGKQPFRPLGQRRAFEQIPIYVEEAINEGRLKSGERLAAERELAEGFGLSWAAVREALRAPRNVWGSDGPAR